METTQIKLDKNVVDKAVAIPDIVLSLLGAGQSVGEEDLNGREAYQKHLEEKYR